MTRRPGSRSADVVAVGRDLRQQQQPRAGHHEPDRQRNGAVPTRVTRTDATIDEARAVSDIASQARPVSIGE